MKFHNEIISLLVAIIVPVIVFILIKDILDEKPINKAKTYLFILALILISAIGSGIIINNLLYHYNYFVAIWTFKGVKIAHSLPLILLAIYIFIRPKRIKYLFNVINRYLSSHLTFKYLIIIILLVSFFALYTLRTGNYGMLILGQLEISFRNLLENIFFIRPRSKEIIFAFPLLMIAIHYWHNKKINSSLLLAIFIFSSITIISQINTFCHFHAPFLVSTYRSILGLTLGALVGLVIIFLINKFLSITEKVTNKLDKWEN